MLRIRTFPWTYSPRTFSLPDNSPSLCTWCRTFPPSTIRRSTYKAIYTVNVYKIDRVDRVGSGIRVSAIFQNISRLVGRLGSGVRVSASFQTFAFTSSSYFICREHVNVKKTEHCNGGLLEGLTCSSSRGKWPTWGGKLPWGCLGNMSEGGNFQGECHTLNVGQVPHFESWLDSEWIRHSHRIHVLSDK